ncbi:MAG: hypothetical protein ACP5SH_18020, partial [Syntrophobacteraceae bacterium]
MLDDKPTVTLLNVRKSDKPSLTYEVYRLCLTEQQLLITQKATSIYSDFFCGRFGGIISILKMKNRNIDINTESALFSRLKKSFLPESLNVSSLNVYDTTIPAFVKMTYDIHSVIAQYITSTQSKSKATNNTFHPASGEIEPVITKFVNPSHEARYLLDLSERLFFALSKALYLYEAIQTGHFSAIHDTVSMNGITCNIDAFNNALGALHSAYFDKCTATSVTADVKIAHTIRSVIEHHHPELQGIATDDVLPYESELPWTAEEYEDEIRHEIIHPSTTVCDNRPRFSLSYARTHLKLSVTIGTCLLVMIAGVFYLHIRFDKHANVAIAHHTADKYSNVNAYRGGINIFEMAPSHDHSNSIMYSAMSNDPVNTTGTSQALQQVSSLV